MKKASGKTTMLLTLVLVFSFVLQGMTVFAASSKKADLTVSASGKSFKLTKGDNSYSFKYNWSSKKKAYTGFSQKKINKLVPFSATGGTPKGIQVGVSLHKGTAKEDGILVGDGVTINKKIYRGMTLASFHKNISAAWGKGHYGYYDQEKHKAVNAGTKKPTNAFVKKRCKDTGIYWVGNRGRMKIDVSFGWNKAKKRAEVNWIEITVKQ